MEVVTRPLPDGVTYIKTVFEYGGMPNYTGTTMRKQMTEITTWRLHHDFKRNLN